MFLKMGTGSGEICLQRVSWWFALVWLIMHQYCWWLSVQVSWDYDMKRCLAYQQVPWSSFLSVSSFLIVYYLYLSCFNHSSFFIKSKQHQYPLQTLDQLHQCLLEQCPQWGNERSSVTCTLLLFFPTALCDSAKERRKTKTVNKKICKQAQICKRVVTLSEMLNPMLNFKAPFVGKTGNNEEDRASQTLVQINLFRTVQSWLNCHLIMDSKKLNQ